LEFRQYFKPEQEIDPSQTHTLEALIQSSIRYSDNYATIELAKHAEPGSLNNLLSELHIEIPVSNADFITVKDYATFFRVLFNASYLNQDNSEKALELLSKTTFTEGIVKLLPPETLVAHKFGEKEPNPQGIRQIHDCGIVYYPLHPYLICVMTRGTDPDQMAQTIAEISRLVYEEVSKQVE
jgi:hypothetical protein